MSGDNLILHTPRTTIDSFGNAAKPWQIIVCAGDGLWRWADPPKPDDDIPVAPLDEALAALRAIEIAWNTGGEDEVIVAADAAVDVLCRIEGRTR